MRNIAILIRHGESESNVKGLISEDLSVYPLTHIGKQQADKTGKELLKLKVDRIIASPVLRARETASILSEIIHVPIEINNEIRESGLGPYNNTQSRIIPEGKRESLGFEPYDAIRKRMIKSIMGYDGTNVFVSHELPIKAVISEILDMDEEESRGIKLKNASISILDCKNRKLLCIGASEISIDLIKKIDLQN
ncbi:MAG: histidine phosphatase family protein [Thermoplasmataceae archaeon]